MAWWDSLWPVIAALLPTIGLLFLFFVILKRIVEGDRRERAAQRRWEQEREAALAKARQERARAAARDQATSHNGEQTTS